MRSQIKWECNTLLWNGIRMTFKLEYTVILFCERSLGQEMYNCQVSKHFLKKKTHSSIFLRFISMFQLIFMLSTTTFPLTIFFYHITSKDRLGRYVLFFSKICALIFLQIFVTAQARENVTTL